MKHSRLNVGDLVLCTTSDNFNGMVGKIDEVRDLEYNVTCTDKNGAYCSVGTTYCFYVREVSLLDIKDFEMEMVV